MSPYNYNGGAIVFRVNSTGNLDAPNVNNTNGVRQYSYKLTYD